MNYTLVQDTREQTPWPIPRHPVHDWDSRITTLPTGDYTVAQYERQLRIERKGLSDLMTCLYMPNERTRFANQLSRLQKFPVPILAIEADQRNVIGWRVPNGRRIAVKARKTGWKQVAASLARMDERKTSELLETLLTACATRGITIWWLGPQSHSDFPWVLGSNLAHVLKNLTPDDPGDTK